MLSTRAGSSAQTAVVTAAGAGAIPRRVAIQDCAFLFGIVLLSGLSYVSRLGFYFDDWSYWGIMYGSRDQSLTGLLHCLWSHSPDLHVRPVQALYLGLTYFTFGLHPLPYHLTNTLVLAFTAVLFYASLRELQLPHCITLAVPMVYALLPHYATDRFWIAAHQAVFSLAFFFLGLYAGLRATRGGRMYSFCLQAVSIGSFAIALLSYEVILGLLPASLLLTGYGLYTKRRAHGGKPEGLMLRDVGYFPAAAVCLGLVFLYKTRVQIYVGSPYQLLISTHIGPLFWDVVKGAIKFNVLHYGVGLPWGAFVLYRYTGVGAWSVIFASVIAVSILLYLPWTLRKSPSGLLSGKVALSLIAAGFIVFALGYAPLAVLHFGLTTMGIDNRVTIAAAVGAACVLVGGSVLLIRAVAPARLQVLSFCGAIAVICGLNFVCIASFAECWAQAYIQQREIVAEVRKNVVLPAGTTLLLDGFCRYVGPAMVFVTDWDAQGVLQIAYGDTTLGGDVVSPAMEIGDDVITTRFYGELEGQYAYGERLWLHNVQRKTTLKLTDSLVARNYFRTVNPGKNSGCPAGFAGIGAPTPW